LYIKAGLEKDRLQKYIDDRKVVDVGLQSKEFRYEEEAEVNTHKAIDYLDRRIA